MKRILNTGKMLILALIFVLTTNTVSAQQRIYQGLRVPQLTTAERAQIGAEANSVNARGMLIFNTDSLALQFWNGTEWMQLADEQSLLNYITNNITQELIDSIMANVNITSDDNTVSVVGSGTSDIDLAVNIGVIADSLVSNETFITNLMDTLVTNSYFTENIFNELYNDEHLLQLLDSIAALIANGGDVHNFIQEIVNQISQDTYITQLGDSIVNYITNNFPEELGQTILNYITNNVTQELTDSIMANVNITSDDNTVSVVGSGTSDIDLAVNIGVIADSLVSNETFITNLMDTLVTNSYFTENIFNELYNDEHLLQLLDSIAALIANGGDVHNFIQEIVNQISQDTYITQLGDSIVNYITNNFPEELGQTILNYITNNVTQELTDSIMANVVVEGDNGIIVEGSGTSNITVKLPEGGKDGQLLVWNHTLQTWAPTDPLPTTKQVTIPVANGTFNTENLIFYGSTAATTNPLQVISIEPIFANPTLRRNFLRVNAEFQVEDRVIEWSVSIENRNFNPINEFTLVSIIITYICGDTTPLTSDTQGYSILVGY